MAGLGYLFQGLAKGMQQAKERKRQMALDAEKADYMKIQKKILDLQWKEMEKKQLLDAEMGDIDPIEKSLMDKDPLAYILLNRSGMFRQKQQEPQGIESDALQMSIPTAPQQAQGLPDMASDMTTRSLWKKAFGLDPGQIDWRSGVADPQSGIPTTIGVDPTGKVLHRFPQAVEKKFHDVEIPGQGKFKVPFDPYGKETQQPGDAPQIVSGAVKVGPSELEWRDEETPGGQKISKPFYKNTQIPAGPGFTKEQQKGETSDKAGRMQLAESGISELTRVKQLLYNKDGTINMTNVFNATEFPGIGAMPRTKGREMRQALKRSIDSIIRAATGAALNETELLAYADMYTPSYGDDDQAIKNKMAALDKFLNGYLYKMDPTGKLRSNLGGQATSGLKPVEGKDYDYEYVPKGAK